MSSPGNEQLPESRFAAGLDDIVIVPLVLTALALKWLARGLFWLLVRLLDYAFPILLQVVRFPLFTLRMIGDALAALTRGVIALMPVSMTRRAAWRDAVSRYWAWLRQKFSYKAFEQALHDWFEGGMAWVFRRCRALTPRTALLVLLGAVIWLPVSFGIATVIHAVLIAKALTLPAWMQSLHVLATVIAKSKLLVLPVYPASWPQAKKHGVMQAIFDAYGYVARLHFTRKIGHRYGQAEYAVLDAADAIGHTLARVGFKSPAVAIVNDFNAAAARVGRALRTAALWSVERLARAPLIGPLVTTYAAHYQRAEQKPAGKASERMGRFFEHWAVKFSAEYYEAKEREEAAKRQGNGSPPR